MTETGVEQGTAGEDQRVLAGLGCSELQAELVLDVFAPEALLDGLAPERRADAVSRGARYVKELEVARFQDRNLDLTLVVPPFVAPELISEYEAAIELAVAGRPAVTEVFGSATRAREQSWLRAVHLHLAVADHFGVAPELNLPEVPLLQRLQDSEDLTLAYRAFDRSDLSELQALASDVTATELAPRAPLRPGQISERSGELVRPFEALDDLLRAADAQVREAVGWSRSERRAHQEVLAVARVAASSLGRESGSTLNLLLELEAVAPPGQRVMERFPLLRLHTLWALRTVRPAAFGHIRRESDLHSSSLRAMWTAITIGVPDADGPRAQGVVGLLAAAAHPSVEQFRTTMAAGGR